MKYIILDLLYILGLRAPNERKSIKQKKPIKMLNQNLSAETPDLMNFDVEIKQENFLESNFDNMCAPAQNTKVSTTTSEIMSLFDAKNIRVNSSMSYNQLVQPIAYPYNRNVSSMHSAGYMNNMNTFYQPQMPRFSYPMSSSKTTSTAASQALETNGATQTSKSSVTSNIDS